MAFAVKTRLQGTFVNDCHTLDHVAIVERWIYRPVPYAFRSKPKEFSSWRDALAGCLGVSVEDIVVVGSTAAGLSLSPDKALRMHSPHSDVDVGIVSRRHFDLAWTWMLEQKTRRIGYPPAVNSWIMDHQQTHIFYKKIACDLYLEYLPFGRDWIACLEAAGKRPPAAGRDVKVRVYADRLSLTNYTASGVQALRQRLNLPGATA